MTEDGSSHADYIYARDKKFKDNLNATKISERIVPEVSGKKRLLETNFENKMQKEKIIENQPEKVKPPKKVTFEEQENTFEHVLKTLNKYEHLLTYEEKQECVKILKCKRSNMLLFVCIILTNILIICLLFRMKSTRMN